jgi:hypothetical protein
MAVFVCSKIQRKLRKVKFFDAEWTYNSGNNRNHQGLPFVELRVQYYENLYEEISFRIVHN